MCICGRGWSATEYLWSAFYWWYDPVDFRLASGYGATVDNEANQLTRRLPFYNTSDTLFGPFFGLYGVSGWINNDFQSSYIQIRNFFLDFHVFLSFRKRDANSVANFLRSHQATLGRDLNRLTSHRIWTRTHYHLPGYTMTSWRTTTASVTRIFTIYVDRQKSAAASATALRWPRLTSIGGHVKI